MTTEPARRLLLDINSLEFAYRAPRRQGGLDGSRTEDFVWGRSASTSTPGIFWPSSDPTAAVKPPCCA